MKKAFLLALLVSIAGYSQDHFSGITTSKRVGILNIGLNPSELANLNNHFEIQFFSTSLNTSNNKIGFKDIINENTDYDADASGDDDDDNMNAQTHSRKIALP